ncbi:transposase [Hymenobacter guriensis]|uniref:Transposase n=1 Tax=Hymenobacter guriensis TaxID=2793065 RepID=A0ABS0L0I7_9BACT|nr:transposase [Hymenobacter guriensis]MBG8553636.1 transposase [Hymenobacter guriensis]
MDPLPERRSIRYDGYDYRMAGYYALTICARDKAHLFGSLLPDEPLQLSELGELVVAEVEAIPRHHPTIRLDAWVLMPNHLHLILVLTRNRAVGLNQAVGAFKSRCYGRWRAARLAAGQPAPPSCWQRNYYERIIRNPAELDAQRRYLLENPSRWNNT